MAVYTGTGGADVLSGSAGNDTLLGLGGSDTLTGNGGVDSLVGGSGDDTYYSDADDIVIENVGEGVDTIISSVSVDMANAQNVENLVLTGSGAIDGFGNALNNVIVGNSGANKLHGGGGVDTLIGGDGDDYYRMTGDGTVVENAGEGVDMVVLLGSVTSYTLADNVENLLLNFSSTRIANGNALNNFIVGTNQGDTLNGGGGDDTIEGNDGSDVLIGGAGNDTLSGNTGDDVFYVDDVGDVVIEAADEGVDTVISSVSWGLGGNVENLVLAGTANINGTGNGQDNSLTGNAGTNTLVGGDGDDVLEGRDGADLLIGGNGTDTVSYANATGSVIAGLDDGSGSGVGYLGEASGDVLLGMENLRGSGFSDQLLGNSGANTLWGGDGDDLLDGLGGADRLDGGNGDDAASYRNSSAGVAIKLDGSAGAGGDAAGDVLVGIENLHGSDFSDTLVGSSGANTIIGYDGDDTIQGLGGSDYLMGNDGNDTISYAGLNEGVAVVLQWNGVLDNGYGFYGSETDTLASFENIRGTEYDDIFFGSEVANVLRGEGGSDTLLGAAGADTLIGGAGDDIYLFGGGDGQDVIIENDSSTNTDVLDISGVAVDQIWFRQLGNDLEVSIIGTSDKVTIADWYSGSAHHVEQFSAAGEVLLDSQVANLVSAMSAFSPPSAGQTTLPPTYQSALATVIATNWQ